MPSRFSYLQTENDQWVQDIADQGSTAHPSGKRPDYSLELHHQPTAFKLLGRLTVVPAVEDIIAGYG